MSTPDDGNAELASPWEDPRFSLTDLMERIPPSPDRSAILERAHVLMHRPKMDQTDGDAHEAFSE